MSQEPNSAKTSLVSKDADPLHPRDREEVNYQRHQELQEPEDPADQGETFVNIPMPDPNWCFNNFLVDLADEIDGDELDKLKHLFIDIIGRRILEKITTTRGLFDHLRRQTYLSRNNLLYLQTILRKLNRPELIRMVIEYAKKVGNVIHYHEAPADPPNGFTSFKVHVEGKDFRKCNSKYIDDLRLTVSTLLFIPPQDVLIAGIEPSSSMLVTLMIPDVYADILLEMIQHNEPLQQLIDVDIDIVQIGDKIYNIRGIEGVEIIETKEQAKLVSLFRQLQDKSRQLESVAEETVSLSEEKRILERKFDELQMETVVLRTIFYGSSGQPATLLSQSAFRRFMQSLEEVKKRDYDRSVVQQLLQANTVMVANRSREESDIKIKQLGLVLDDLRSQVIPLQHELQILRLTESRDHDQLLRDYLLQLLLSIRTSTQVEVQLNDDLNEILKKLSTHLRHKEKQKLEKKYTWTPNDKLANLKNDNSSLFLTCLLYKEIERTQKLVDFSRFVDDCLKEVNRPDLQRKFQELISKLQRPQKPRKTPPQDPRPEATPTAPQSEERICRLEANVNTILEKVNGISDKINYAQQYGMPYDRIGNLFDTSYKSFSSGVFGSSTQFSTEATEPQRS